MKIVGILANSKITPLLLERFKKLHKEPHKTEIFENLYNIRGKYLKSSMVPPPKWK